MFKPPRIILGINPGTRYVGLACFVDRDLRDWRVRVVHGKWSNAKRKKLDSAVLKYIDRFDPSTLVIKRLDPIRSSAELRKFTSSLKSSARRRHIAIREYSIEEVEQLVLRDARKNKRRLADAIAQQYPILLSELNRELDRKREYHIRMFEAVALASTSAKSLDSGKKLSRRTRSASK
jgi:Holliday junction resolvasome RuvABC endonuclease subunit